MQKVRRLLRRQTSYEPLAGGSEFEHEQAGQHSVGQRQQQQQPFSWIEYAVFLLLGMAMLWAW